MLFRSSQYWGALNLVTLAPQTFKAFGEVQPNDAFYNQWASVVHQYSNGTVYGFSYDDAFAPVSIGVVKQGGASVARLDIVLLGLPGDPAVIPEVGPGSLLLVAAVGWLVRRRKGTGGRPDYGRAA